MQQSRNSGSLTINQIIRTGQVDSTFAPVTGWVARS